MIVLMLLGNAPPVTSWADDIAAELGAYHVGGEYAPPQNAEGAEEAGATRSCLPWGNATHPTILAPTLFTYLIFSLFNLRWMRH